LSLADDVEEVLIPEEVLRARVQELGRQISSDYEGKQPLLVGILTGAVFFVSDLMRAITIPCHLDFMATSAYGTGTENTGVVRILKDLNESIEGRHVLVVDDIVDTAGTLVRAAETLVRRGVTEVYACCTHPVLSGPAVERIASSPIRELVVTDSIPLPADKRLDQIRVVSVARLLADAITRVHLRSSVSELAEERLAAELV